MYSYMSDYNFIMLSVFILFLLFFASRYDSSVRRDNWSIGIAEYKTKNVIRSRRKADIRVSEKATGREY